MDESNISKRVDSDLNIKCDEEHLSECDVDLKPYIGRKFGTLNDAEDFYRSYGAACGFDVRLGRIRKAHDDTIMSRYMYCSRHGVKGSYSNDSGDTSMKKRRRLATRVYCEAMIQFRFCGIDGYSVEKFKEGHTHTFVSEKYRQFLRTNRKLDYVHQDFIMNCAKSNIGPMKSFRPFMEIVGSYSEIGYSNIDFQNFSRDLKAFVEGVDAQIPLDKFRNKKDLYPDFTFEFSIDDDGKVIRIFWAESYSKKMYRIFGQALPFDATYGTNKYNMIFTPFTGKDNHGKCVTFAAGLLTSEDAESYTWILQKFVECMNVTPAMIITDQDHALKIAVQRAMPLTSHRFCMWHIMKKVVVMIPVSLRDNEGFSTKFNEIVWSETIDTCGFEDAWNQLMEEYQLGDHEWFLTMFELREFWIPTFFKEVPMAGLFRTTSISESSNNFFQRFSNKNSNLLTFYMHLESAVDAQRYAHDKLSNIDESSIPETSKECLFEKHAASVYTTQIFQEKFQKDIRWSASECSIINILPDFATFIYEIMDTWTSKVFRVEVKRDEDMFECECKYFFKYGLLCRHVYSVLKNCLVRRIPEKYIIPRWTRYACSEDLNCDNGKTDKFQAEKFVRLNFLHQLSKRCIDMVRTDVAKMKELTVDFKALVEKFSVDGSKDCATTSKLKEFEIFYDSTIRENIHVLPPDPVKTKGSGSDMNYRRDKAIRDANKPKRNCSKCKLMANHDARNCPNV